VDPSERNAQMAIARVALLLGLLVTGGQASAASSSLPKLEAVGKTLFEQDRAASLATDRLVESTGQLPDGLRGWVTVPSEQGWRVIFVQERGDTYCSMLNVLVDADGAGPLRRSDTCEPLTADQRAMFLARQTALSALRMRCSEAYNTVVLPREGKEGAWAVYLLAATKEVGKVVVGGHVRVLVGDTGSEILDYQQLSNTCLTLDLPSPAAGKPVALVVTHVLDDHPIETHVFLSLLHGLKLYVMTESAMWSVDKGKIRLVMDGEDFKAYLRKAKAAHDKESSGHNN
jgi:hypothetical protein